jgi:hypothetical protein
MKEFWIRSRGQEQDYSWITRTGTRQSQIPEWGDPIRRLDGSAPGIVIWSDEHSFGFAAEGIKTDNSDRAQRAIRLTFVVRGIDREEEARAIAISFLDHWEAREEELRSLFAFSDVPQSEGWKFNFAECEKFFQGWINGYPVGRRQSFREPAIRTNEGPGSSSWKILSNNLRECPLPSGHDLLVLVTKYPNFDRAGISSSPWQSLLKDPSQMSEILEKKNASIRKEQFLRLRIKFLKSGPFLKKRFWVFVAISLSILTSVLLVISGNQRIQILETEIETLRMERKTLAERNRELIQRIDEIEKGRAKGARSSSNQKE